MNGEKVYCNFCHIAIAPAETRKTLEVSANGIKVSFHYHQRHMGDCWTKERTALLLKRAAATGGNRLGVIQ